MASTGSEADVDAIFGVIFLTLGLLLVAGLSNASCSAQWESSGFMTDWGPLKGCLISTDGAVWIPADNYREVP